MYDSLSGLDGVHASSFACSAGPSPRRNASVACCVASNSAGVSSACTQIDSERRGKQTNTHTHTHTHTHKHTNTQTQTHTRAQACLSEWHLARYLHELQVLCARFLEPRDGQQRQRRRRCTTSSSGGANNHRRMRHLPSKLPRRGGEGRRRRHRATTAHVTTDSRDRSHCSVHHSRCRTRTLR